MKNYDWNLDINGCGCFLIILVIIIGVVVSRCNDQRHEERMKELKIQTEQTDE